MTDDCTFYYFELGLYIDLAHTKITISVLGAEVLCLSIVEDSNTETCRIESLSRHNKFSQDILDDPLDATGMCTLCGVLQNIIYSDFGCDTGRHTVRTR